MTDSVDLASSVAAVRSLYAAAAASVALVDDDGGTLRFAAADGEGAAEIVGVELPVGRGIVGWAAMSGQPLSVRDVREDSRFARDVAEATHYVPTCILAAPLFDDSGEVLGVVEVLDPRVDVGADWTLAVLATLAVQLGRLVTAQRRSGAGEEASRLEALARRVVALVDEHRP